MARRVPYALTWLDALAYAGVGLFILLAATDVRAAEVFAPRSGQTADRFGVPSSDGATDRRITPPPAIESVRDCPAALTLPGAAGSHSLPGPHPALRATLSRDAGEGRVVESLAVALVPRAGEALRGRLPQTEPVGLQHLGDRAPALSFHRHRRAPTATDAATIGGRA